MCLIDILGIIIPILVPSGLIFIFLTRYHTEKDVSTRLLDEFRENKDKLENEKFAYHDGVFDRKNYDNWEQRKTETMNKVNPELISEIHKFHTDWTTLYKEKKNITPIYNLTDVNQLKSQIDEIIPRLEKYCNTLKWYRPVISTKDCE